MIYNLIFAPIMNGIVIRTTGKYYTVRKDDREIVQCRLKGKFRIVDIS